MSNDNSQWHSDDDLASALERTLGSSSHPATSEVPIPAPSVSELFAALVETESPQQDSSVTESAVVAQPVDEEPALSAHPQEVSEAREQIFESLDDFRPRTNFIPVVSPESRAPQAGETQEAQAELSPAVPSITTENVAPEPVSTSQVTTPITWKPLRKSFDEIVFGISFLNQAE